MSHHGRMRITIITLAAAAALTLSGCGSDSTDKAELSATSVAPTSSAAPSSSASPSASGSSAAPSEGSAGGSAGGSEGGSAGGSGGGSTVAPGSGESLDDAVESLREATKDIAPSAILEQLGAGIATVVPPVTGHKVEGNTLTLLAPSATAAQVSSICQGTAAAAQAMSLPADAKIVVQSGSGTKACI